MFGNINISIDGWSMNGNGLSLQDLTKVCVQLLKLALRFQMKGSSRSITAFSRNNSFPALCHDLSISVISQWSKTKTESYHFPKCTRIPKLHGSDYFNSMMRLYVHQLQNCVYNLACMRKLRTSENICSPHMRACRKLFTCYFSICQPSTPHRVATVLWYLPGTWKKALSCMFKCASAAAITALSVIKCAPARCFFRFENR